MKFSDEQMDQLKTVMNIMFDLKLKPIKRAISAMRKDLNWVMGRYDSRLVHLEKHAVHPPGRADN